jgi:hypothetical protein
MTMGNLTAILDQLDDLSEAKAPGLQVLDWRETHLGSKHYFTILAIENLACTGKT